MPDSAHKPLPPYSYLRRRFGEDMAAPQHLADHVVLLSGYGAWLMAQLISQPGQPAEPAMGSGPARPDTDISN